MPDFRKFVAYPAIPSEIANVISEAVRLRKLYTKEGDVKAWPELDIAGHFLGSEVLQGIDNVDCVFADISALNFNVTFEVGYAIAKKKRIILTKCTSYSGNPNEISELGIFDTIGWKEYLTSDDYSRLLSNASSERPIELDTSQINKNTPLYLLEAKFKTDPHVKIRSCIKKARIFFRSFDPEETARLSASEAIFNVARSAGVVVTLIPADQRDAKLHNLRAAFIAGLAYGMGKHLLIAQLGEDPVPIDYRDFVKVCKRQEQIEDAIAELAPKITELLQTKEGNQGELSKSLLSKLNIGQPAAENEFQDLGSYYLETASFQRALRGEVRVVLGRKGSGKTALFAQLRDRIRIDRKVIVVDLKPDGWKLIKFKEDVLNLLQEGTLEHTVTAFWEYILLLEIAYKILEKDEEVHLRDSTLFPIYRSLADTYNIDGLLKEGDFSERMAKVVERIRNDLHSKHSDKTNVRLSSPQVTELIHRHDVKRLKDDILRYLIHKKGVWILVDNIDKGWATDGVKKSDLVIVRTLLDAAVKLERDLRPGEYRCNTVVFLRNDVYEMLVEETSDRGKVSTERLDWTDPEALQEMLRKRFAHNDMSRTASFSQMWNRLFVSHIGTEESASYIIARSMMRPRELIKAFESCCSAAVNRGHERIESTDVETGLRSHAMDLIEEISLEIRDVFPQVRNAVYLLIGVNKVFDKETLRLKFIDGDIAEDDWDRLVDLLLWYGVIGYTDGPDQSLFIYEMKYNMKLLKETAATWPNRGQRYIVNPAFWPLLSSN